MNRLWVRLSLAFGGLVLIGPFLLALTGFFLSQGQAFLFLVRSDMTSRGGLVEQLETYYSQTNSWQGVDALLMTYESSLPPGPNMENFGLILRAIDDSIVYQSRVIPRDYVDPRQTVLPLKTNGYTRGTLSLISVSIPPLALRPQAEAFITRQLSRILGGMAVISAVLGLTAGVVMSRSLTAPIARLAQTVQIFGQRDFTRRAEVKGSLELRQLADAFNHMAENIATAETLRRNLMADVAHELRTPLTVLQANLHALQDGVYALDQAEVARLISQTELLMRLVHELSELAQAEAKQLSLQKRPIDVLALTRLTIDKFKPIAQTQNVHIALQSSAAAVWLTLDASRIEQVLHNLLQNALTHTPEEGVITVSLTQMADSVQLVVQDTGSGIAAEHLPHIFDRFYRVDRSRSRASGGAGLGLAIVKAMVELHGGTITAESDGAVGRGTRFIINLPQSA